MGTGSREQIRLHAIFEGYVQGVGFRYAVRRLAQRYGVSGWVRNLVSGEVELVGEGERGALEKVLETCRAGAGTPGQVRNVWVEWLPASGEFRGFEIRANGPRRSLLHTPGPRSG